MRKEWGSYFRVSLITQYRICKFEFDDFLFMGLLICVSGGREEGRSGGIIFSIIRTIVCVISRGTVCVNCFEFLGIYSKGDCEE